MIGRLFVAAGLATVITFGLFLLMETLIATSEAKLSDSRVGGLMDFVRLRRQETVQAKKRELPPRQRPEVEPAMPEVRVQTASPAVDMPTVPIEMPHTAPPVQMVGGPHLGEVQSDTEIIPLVRVQPIYPRGAAAKELEGWVQVKFTISSTGAVKDPVVVAAEPPNVFERAALRAIRKWKYRPRIENGKAVETSDVSVRLAFALEDI